MSDSTTVKVKLPPLKPRYPVIPTRREPDRSKAIAREAKHKKPPMND